MNRYMALKNILMIIILVMKMIFYMKKMKLKIDMSVYRNIV